MFIEDAIVLTAGYGTRLRPLTLNIPKPLITLNDKPIIEYILEELEQNGVKRAFLNASYLAEQILAYKTKTKIQIYVSKEDNIRGTGGAILSFKEKLKHKKFFVINGDILFKYDLQSLALNRKATAVLLLNKNQGNVLINDGRIEFLEKGVKTGLTYTGIQLIDGRKFFGNEYIISKYSDLLKYSCIVHDIYKKAEFDLAYLIGDNNMLWVDIGSLEGLERAKQILKNLSNQKTF